MPSDRRRTTESHNREQAIPDRRCVSRPARRRHHTDDCESSFHHRTGDAYRSIAQLSQQFQTIRGRKSYHTRFRLSPHKAPRDSLFSRSTSITALSKGRRVPETSVRDWLQIFVLYRYELKKYQGKLPVKRRFERHDIAHCVALSLIKSASGRTTDFNEVG